MNRHFMTLAALLALVLTASTVTAQPPEGRGRGMRGGPMRGGRMMQSPMRLLMNQAVRDELNVTDEQLEKLREVRESQQPQPQAQSFQGDRRSFRDMTQEEREKAREQMQERREEMESRMEEMREKVGEILDADQMKRLNQIMLQTMGPGVLRHERVANALQITEDQRDKLQAAMREMRPERGGGAGAERPTPEQIQERMQAMREKMQDAMKEVLTDEQKTKLDELLGEPFDVSQLQPGPRRAGTPRGPGRAGRPRGGAGRQQNP